MAKYKLRIKARKLRKRGESVKKIAETLSVSKATASLWVRDIILRVDQLEALRKSMLKGKELGRLRSALLQKERRLKLIEESNRLGIQSLKNLKQRELLIAGLALYWGEGSKKTREVEFCNSDPKMIEFLLLWLDRCFGIKRDEIRCVLGINEIHRKREQVVKKYWSKITGIPLSQFNKTNFKRVENKKVYENFNEHYGTLTVSVLKPGRIYYKMLGQIEGLYEAGRRLVFQDVS